MEKSIKLRSVGGIYQSVSIVEASIRQEAKLAKNKRMKLAESSVERKLARVWLGKVPNV